ncbi:unnamed protein product [Onchocerca ochengi]|uniref:Coat protein n=1 Tax=Onchocerca ochengi TaxID=42157 RepID=A0A182E6N6_ONCOC|nr:unnamed protein product [Onchocerca ochengi]
MSRFDVFQQCLHHDTNCKNAQLGVTTVIIDYLYTINQKGKIDTAEKILCKIFRILYCKIAAAVVNHTIEVNPFPEISDAYTLLVYSVLPNECQRLKLFPLDVIHTTSKTDFVDDVKYGNDKALWGKMALHEIPDRMIDLETGQEVTVADVATLMTTAARNISNDFGLRSKENDQILENNAKYGNESEFQDHKTMGSKSK